MRSRPFLAACCIVLLGGCSAPGAVLFADPPSNPFLDPAFQVVVHVGYAEGAEPSAGALEDLVATIEAVGTPARLSAFERMPPSDGRVSFEEAAAAAEALWPLARRGEGDQVAHLRVLYFRGAPEQEETLAFASSWRFGFIAVFPEVLRSEYVWLVSADVPGQDQRLVERAVLVHEYGHLLGLVDCGLPMQSPRADPDSPCHSRNRESVMSALGPSRSPDSWLLRDGMGPVWQFDEQDWQDIRAYQAGQAGQTGPVQAAG